MTAHITKNQRQNVEEVVVEIAKKLGRSQLCHYVHRVHARNEENQFGSASTGLNNGGYLQSTEREEDRNGWASV